MKINGIGTVSKQEVLSIFTVEGKKAIKDGIITWEEAAFEYKTDKVKKACAIADFPDTFEANYSRIPKDLRDKLTPEELAELTEAFYKCYGDGKRDTNE